MPGGASPPRRSTPPGCGSALRPLEEAGYRELMALQADLGDRAAALATYHRCASVLERELGVAPDEATRAAAARLLDRAESPRAGVARCRAGRIRRGPVRRPGARARCAAGGLAAGRGRPRGRGPRPRRRRGREEPARRRGHRGRAPGRRGDRRPRSASRTSGRLALAPVAEWLRTPEVQPAVAGLDPVWRDEVRRLVPTVPSDDGPDDGASARAMVDAWQRHRFYEGLARALLGVGRPTLLVLDDVQWCDQETLTFLGFCLTLSRTLVPHAPLLVAATMRGDGRPDEPEPADWIARMRTAGLLTDLALGPLDGAETARLAEAVRGGPLPEPDRELLAALTGGFPCTSSRPCVRSAGDRSRPATSTPCSAAGSSRPGRPRGRWRRSPRRSAATSRWTCSSRRVSWTSTVSSPPSTSCGGCGSCASAARATTSPTTCCATPRTRRSPRRGAGCCTGASRRDSRSCTPTTSARSRRSSPSSTPAVAGPSGPSRYYRRAAEVATCVFAHAEAVRLDTAALEIVRSRPPGRDRDAEELAVLEAMAAPLNAHHGYASVELQAVLERSVTLAESLGRRTRWSTGWSGCSRRGSSRDGSPRRTRSRPGRSLSSSRTPRPAGPRTSRCRSGHEPRPGPQAVRHLAVATDLGRGCCSASAPASTCTRGRGHRTRTGSAATTPRRRPACGRRSRSRGRWTTPTASRCPSGTPPSCGRCATTGPELRRTVAELRELCARYGFGYYREWGTVLDGWCRGGPAGVELAREGIEKLVADGALARMPYWLALLADLLDRTGDHDGARTVLDTATADARKRDDVWWLPEVLRMRAAYDDGDDAVARLREAARLAADHGSVPLLRRCEHDLTRVLRIHAGRDGDRQVG